MKAVCFAKSGGVEVLKYGDVADPQLNAGETLVRVKACALNRLDIWLRLTLTPYISLPHIPGSDVSGTIEKINGKSSFKVGQAVVINPALPCYECPKCKSGLACEMVRILGFNTQGGYAEFVKVPTIQLYPKPKKLSFVEVAAFPLTFLTAWHMLVTRANLQKGETVFIWGASGGLGTAAIQIARYLGATVLCAAKSAKIVNQLQKIGCHKSFIYTQKNLVEQVKNFNRGRGVDVAFESVGQKTWPTSLALLHPLGRVVIAGTTSGNLGSQDLSDVYVRQLSILGACMGSAAEFETVLRLIANGKIKPVVDKVFPLRAAKDAQLQMELGKHVGKIILEI